MTPELAISIVSTCRNCEKYIEKTILSITGQSYGNLQFIVIDGASTDSTMEIVAQHRSKIDTVISEPDEGQYYGIQKGLSLCTGEIMAWLNADDMYYPWTFSVVNAVFKKFPQVDWIIGQPSYINAENQCIRVSGNAGTAYPRTYIKNGWFRASLAGYLQQESMFWRRSLWEKSGGLNLTYQYAADFDLWARFAVHADLYSVTVPLAAFRKLPGEQKSSLGRNEYEREVAEICRPLDSPPFIWRTVAKKSVAMEHLCRLMIWKKCGLITYSERAKDWLLTTATRPLSRASIAEALLEWHVR
jgi:hypothetical protein